MKIQVETKKPYTVFLERGALKTAGEFLLPFCPGKYAAIVTDQTVDVLHGKTLEDSLCASGIRFVKFVIPPGETSKNAEQYIKLLEFLAKEKFTRTDLLLAFGGGVVGDLAGFAAATFLRGIPFIQIPTTLLAMVDSSVGGKTAIDLMAGKNLAGAFYQPKAVLCDTAVLETLPETVLSDGCAEVIKYGILGDAELFWHLKEAGMAFDRERVTSACIKMKGEIVAEDEFDRGRRQLLNLGHTFGHAIEACSRYAVSHGKAVAIGMVMMAECAAANGLCEKTLPGEIEAICSAFGLPTRTDYGKEALYAALLGDKKRQGDAITLVVPEGIGRCRLYPVPIGELKAFLESGM